MRASPADYKSAIPVLPSATRRAHSQPSATDLASEYFC